MFLIGIVLFMTSCVLVFYSYKSWTLENLKQKNDHIKETWSLLYKKSSARLLVMESLTDNSNCDKSIIDSIIINNKSNRNPSKIEELWNLEYTINKAYLQLEKCFENTSSNKTQTNSLKLNAEKLNKIVDEYNANVLDFNQYYSKFPNFLLAKKNGFKREEFFYLKYGENNDDYYNQKKKVQKWVETGKWE